MGMMWWFCKFRVSRFMLRWMVLGLGALGLGSGSLGLPALALTQAECEAEADYVYIPAGPFLFGSTPKERDYGYQISALAAANDPAETDRVEQQLRQQRWFAGEPDQQSLSLDAFCLRKHLVTQTDYQQFVIATQHRAPGISADDYQRQGFLVHPYSTVEAYLWNTTQFPPSRSDHPVVLVSLADAQAYAHWLTEKDPEWNYKLPSREQWEKAARGPDGGWFPWGNVWRDEATNWGGIDPQGTSGIGAFPLSRSPYGVEDMAGNVFEYTSTLLTRGDQQVVVMKGCSWDDLPGFCRAAYQHTRPPESRHILFGFRLVRSPSVSEQN